MALHPNLNSAHTTNKSLPPYIGHVVYVVAHGINRVNRLQMYSYQSTEKKTLYHFSVVLVKLKMKAELDSLLWKNSNTSQ